MRSYVKVILGHNYGHIKYEQVNTDCLNVNL